MQSWYPPRPEQRWHAIYWNTRSTLNPTQPIEYQAMIRSFSRNWLLSVWKLPAVFCVICVTAAILIIVPLGGSAAIQSLINSVCGWIFLLTFIANAVHLLGTAVYYFLKMKNLRALWQITGCVLIWFIGVLLFIRVAVEADPPSPYQTKQTVS